ncbi:hypothetical protein QQF64_006606 [Cirrhinus molitorella]|uniref:Uncharacterized protein n=1 Tax=Cirrhinus molitorella TaxID=172907 RepID=A0ABR3MAQ3_9TELE
MRRFWDKPFSHRVPVKGYSRLDVHNMEELGMSTPPPPQSNCQWLVTFTPIGGKPCPPPPLHCWVGQRGFLLLSFNRSMAPLPWLSEL